MATEFNSYLGVKFKFDSAEARADIVKLLNDLDYFEKKLKNNFDTESIKRWTASMDIAKQGLYEFGVEVDTVTQQSYQNFRAIGQMDRITREFASGGLNQGLNGLTMFGNSLTRLAVQEGGFKNAIAGLASSFAGPAGIVLAVSAAIGIFEHFSKAAAEAEKESNKLFKETGEEVAKVEVLVSQYNKQNISLEERKTIIGKLNNLSPEYFGNLNKENTSVAQLNKSYKEYSANLVNIIMAKKLEAELSQKVEERLKFEHDTGILLYKDVYNPEQLNKRNENLNKYNSLLKQESDLASKIADITKVSVGSNGGQKDYASADELARIEREIQLNKEWANEEYKLYEQRRKFGNKNANISPFEINQGEAPEKLQKGLPDWMNQYIGESNRFDATLKKQEADAKQFSNLISKTLTSDLMNLWSVMQQGKDVGPAIGDMFAKLAEQIAAAAIQAAIFATIMDALGFGGLKGSSFGDIFGNLLGIGGSSTSAAAGLNGVGSLTTSSISPTAIPSVGGSSGGSFVLKGNDLVLALQRSNYSLDLRRGA